MVRAERAIGIGGRPSGATLALSPGDAQGHLLAPCPRAHHFRRLISSSVSMAISRFREHALQLGVLGLQSVQLLDVGRLQLAEVPAPGLQRLLRDRVLAGHLSHAGTVGLAQGGHHRLVGGTALLRGLITVKQEPWSRVTTRRAKRRRAALPAEGSAHSGMLTIARACNAAAQIGEASHEAICHWKIGFPARDFAS
jgi:hypothetical protein